jgi:hypothetical protein
MATTCNQTEICYHARFGMLVRRDGRTSPVSFDEVEQEFGQHALDRAMENPGHYVAALPAPQPVTRAVVKRVAGWHV